MYWAIIKNESFGAPCTSAIQPGFHAELIIARATLMRDGGWIGRAARLNTPAWDIIDNYRYRNIVNSFPVRDARKWESSSSLQSTASNIYRIFFLFFFFHLPPYSCY